MTTFGIVVAAGSGTRFGGNKQLKHLAGRPLWAMARDALVMGGVDDVVLVGPVPGGVAGGERRRDSVAAGLSALPAGIDHVLVHDAARPLASPALVGRVLTRLREGDVDGVVPALGVRDTLKAVSGTMVDRTVERGGLVAAQTPQGFVVSSLLSAHQASDVDATDDAMLIEQMGGSVATVEGESTNLKVTYPEDLLLAEGLIGGQTKVGMGYDAHRFGGQPPLLAGGVAIEQELGVEATSDGDVVAHAVADAVLGAAVDGDLGSHFPSSDPQWEGADSMALLADVIANSGLRLLHLDVTVVAEAVRIDPHRTAIRQALATAFSVGVDLVSVKATTTDGLGGIGAGDGIAATAVATMFRM